MVTSHLNSGRGSFNFFVAETIAEAEAHAPPPPPPLFLRAKVFFIKRNFSANYDSLDFSPRCQENAYLALGFSFLAHLPCQHTLQLLCLDVVWLLPDFSFWGRLAPAQRTDLLTCPGSRKMMKLTEDRGAWKG